MYTIHTYFIYILYIHTYIYTYMHIHDIRTRINTYVNVCRQTDWQTGYVGTEYVQTVSDVYGGHGV